LSAFVSHLQLNLAKSSSGLSPVWLHNKFEKKKDQKKRGRNFYEPDGKSKVKNVALIASYKDLDLLFSNGHNSML
jgi:hypothetical protein